MVVPGGPGTTGLPRVAHDGDAQLVAFQEPAEQLPDLPVVVHHQDMRHLFHADIIGGCRLAAACVAVGCISSPGRRMAAMWLTHVRAVRKTREMGMRRTVLAAIAAVSIAAAGGGALLAQAQPAPAPPAAHGRSAVRRWTGRPAGPGAGWMRWMHHRWERGEGRRRPFEPGTFALFHRPDDRQLTPADVQTIAQALLVWNGNHTWKVIDVGPGADGQIGFAYAAPDNTVIARFSIDTKTGRLTRTG